jgi:hypothetical protein
LGIKKLQDKEKKLILLQCIKQTTLDIIEVQNKLFNKGVLNILVDELKIFIKLDDIHDLFGLTYKIYSQILNSLFNLCSNAWVVVGERINLLSEISINEIIYIIKNELPLSNFAYKLLFGYAIVRDQNQQSSKNFINNNGLFYIFILR